MQAAVYRQFGGPEVVRIEEVPTPEPAAGEVRIRIRATTASMADYRMRTRDLPDGLGFMAPLALGIFGPRKRILGMDLAGTIDAVGEGVTKWSVGDEVIAMPGFRFGGHAQYIVLKDDGPIAKKPAAMSFEDAVTLVFGGGTIAAFFEQFPIKRGDNVLVNGGSSSTGTAAIQLAKFHGATVTAITSGRNDDLVRSLGADTVVDYTKEDLASLTGPFNTVIDCIGNAYFEKLEHAMAPGAVFMPVASDLHTMLTAGGKARRSGRHVAKSDVRPTAANLAAVVAAADAGAFRPVIEATYDFDQIVEAHRLLDTKRKRGNIVVRVP